MKKIWLLLMSICLCLCTLTGCYVQNKMYRMPSASLIQVLPPPPLYAKKPAPDGPPCTAASLALRPCLAFLEFDDMGERWNQSSQPIGEGDAIDNASQLSNAVKIIRAAAKQDPHALIITFIHGWKHNASKDDTNVEGFKQVLNFLYKQYSSTPGGRSRNLAVVGVYISWRGNLVSEHWPVRQQFTYFNREATAARVPGPSLTEALLAITSAAHENNDATHHPLVLLVGHSFGGLLLERGFAQATVDQIKIQAGQQRKAEKAVEQAADRLYKASEAASLPDEAKSHIQELCIKLRVPPVDSNQENELIREARRVAASLDRMAPGDPGDADTPSQRGHDVITALIERQQAKFSPPADLVIFVNSAAAATEAKETLDFLASNHFEYDVDGRRAPLFLAVSSSSDAATKFAMPIGHGLPFLEYKTKGSFRTGRPAEAAGPASYELACYEPKTQRSDYFNPPPTQGAFFMSTAAHMEILQSHLVKEVTSSTLSEKACEDLGKDDPARTLNYWMRDAARCFKVAERPNRCNGTPYWLMEIDPSIVPDHGTIFTGRFTEFLSLFIPDKEKLDANDRPRLFMAK